MRVPSRGGIDPYEPVLECMSAWLGEHGLACREDLERLARAWRRWAEAEDAWFFIPHGEILGRA